MNDLKLEIKDYYELLNLHKALLEAKFHLNPDNTYVCSSPIIADISNKIVDILSEMDDIKDEKNVGKWVKWRKLDVQSFYRERALRNGVLNDMW